MVGLDLDFVRSIMPERDPDGHKGTFGTSVIVAGSPDITGAQALAAEASLRSGAGITRIYAPYGSLIASRIRLPSAVISSFPDSAADTVRLERSRMKDGSAYAIGPGIDPADDRMQAMLYFLITEAPRLVIDATAIRMIARDREFYLPLLSDRMERGLAPAILTPHAGELSDLTGAAVSDKEALIEGACEIPSVVVCKLGSRTEVTVPRKGAACSLTVPNSGMAKGGSGDVLTGLITGLLAQGMSPEDAACAGVFIHAKAGERAAELHTERFMQPTDVIDCFKNIYEGIENGR